MFSHLDVSDGFHVLKDAWTQKSYIGVHSHALTLGLTEAIAATREAVQTGDRDFMLDGEPNNNVAASQRERALEAAMLIRWGVPNMWGIPGAWSRLVAYQVPLFFQQAKEGWGYIDLLGATADGLPVVVELKREPSVEVDGKTKSTETPLRIVLEAVSYAIAIQSLWQYTPFKTQWIQRLEQLYFPAGAIAHANATNTLDTVPIVGAAPAAFWIDWSPFTDKGQNGVNNEDWGWFNRLLTNLASAGFPSAFVSISGEPSSPESLAVQPLKGFWVR